MNRSLVAMLLVLALVPATASAVPITFIHTGIGSGSLSGVPFADADFTITSTGDTANRQFVAPDVYSTDHATSSIAISGVGTFAFLSPTRTFDNFTIGVVGFSRGGADGIDLFDGPSGAAFQTWDMLRSIGPITGTADLIQWSGSTPINTTGGTLVFFDRTDTPATFQAIVPEPSAGALTALGVVALMGSRRFRRK